VAAVVVASLVAATPAGAQTENALPTRDAGPGRDVQAAERVPVVQQGRFSQRGLDRAYPRQQVLAVPTENPDDRSIKLGLVPYHGLAPALNALQARSNRVSVEVIGESVLGRELYLVTVTSPETAGEAAQQEQLRRRIAEQPLQAAGDAGLTSRYKAPFFVNNNIHGNEWEGTDASLALIEDLATSTDPDVAALLDRTRLYFVMTMNPDGRVAGTRANANGFDMNRDFITQSQPETVAVRQALIDAQPLVMLDIHGYVNGTLIEPCTPPHGQNYEYDLFIKHAYANGLGMEAAVLDLGLSPDPVASGGDGVRAPQIPFRDRAEGWDDWPPIFTPQYAAFHGAIAHTIEIPLSVNGSNYNNLPVAELQRRSSINTRVADATIRASLAYLDENRERLIADQIEIFGRGTLAEPSVLVPEGFVPGFGPEDQFTTTFPAAYVVPAGAAQRSPVAAARLVDHLVMNDVEVTRAQRPFVAGGTSYPAGSYVVDMRQSKRGLANVMLEAGGDVSDRVDDMYDISAWSHRLLWGASVDVITGANPRVVGRPVVVADPTGAVAPGTGDLSLRLDDPKDAAALNALLDAGADVRWAGDGSVRVAAAARPLATELANRLGVRFAAADAGAGPVLDRLVVAAAAPADELYALREMGFEVRPVSTAVLNGGFVWDDVDALFVSAGLVFNSLNPAARSAFQAFLAGGGGVVTRGGTGATFNLQAGLLLATRTAARGDASAVVAVDGAGGPLSAGAPSTLYVQGPAWFTNLGPEVTVEQRYGADPVVSGFWPTATTGPAAAAGQAAVIRGVDETGAGVVVFGTEPLYRAHPKGTFATVARALHWATTGAWAPVP
jgi:hypothetical protein